MTPATADLSDLEDEELIPLARQGRPQALRLLFRRHRGGIVGYLRTKFGVDRARAEEIAQDTARRAFEHLFRFDADQSSWRTWLYTIAANYAKNELRNRDARRDDLHYADASGDVEEPRSPHAGPLLEDPDASADSLQRSRALRQKIVEAAAQLEPHHRIVFLLREFENFTYNEICGAVGLKLGSVKSRLARARKEFRGNLEKIDPEVAERYDSDRTKRPASV